MTNCPNLKELFGDRFRVVVEESYYADTGNEKRVAVDPWLLLIPGKHGHCFPWSETRLAVSVDGHTGIAKRIARLPCVQVEQDGDFGELTASFQCADFDTIDEIIHFRRRILLSDAEKERRRQLMAVLNSREERSSEPRNALSPVQT